MILLSKNAQALCAALFRGYGTNPASVTFNTPANVGPEAKIALEELVEKKIITVEHRHGILIYTGTPAAQVIGESFSQKYAEHNWPHFSLTI